MSSNALIGKKSVILVQKTLGSFSPERSRMSVLGQKPIPQPLLRKLLSETLYLRYLLRGEAGCLRISPLNFARAAKRLVEGGGRLLCR